MAKPTSGVELYKPGDVPTWLQSDERQVFIGDVLDQSNSEAMGVGFARYGPGASNEWVVTYDEALIITSGSFSVISTEGKTTAKVGEVIFLRAGTKLTYAAEEDGAELIYVMYPHFALTEHESKFPDLYATFHPMDGAPARFADGPVSANIALLRRIYDPLERGEEKDFQLFDALADDVVFQTSVMELHGKEAVKAYFAVASEMIEFNPFERPLRYFGAGNQVLQWGLETFRVKETGVTHQAEWAWVFDFRDGQIIRIVVIQDLSGISAEIKEAGSKAQDLADERAADSNAA